MTSRLQIQNISSSLSPDQSVHGRAFLQALTVGAQARVAAMPLSAQVVFVRYASELWSAVVSRSPEKPQSCAAKIFEQELVKFLLKMSVRRRTWAKELLGRELLERLKPLAMRHVWASAASDDVLQETLLMVMEQLERIDLLCVNRRQFVLTELNQIPKSNLGPAQSYFKQPFALPEPPDRSEIGLDVRKLIDDAVREAVRRVLSTRGFYRQRRGRQDGSE